MAHTDARDEARRGLYVHVPFCARRCSYCDFSTGSISAARVERYLAAIEREAALEAPAAAGIEFTSVFFGGGTPSALAARHFRRLWSTLRAHFTIAPRAEITLEANPESVGATLLDAWAEAGVNRLSMGAQSFDPEELTRLGRIHSFERPATAFALARAHGFRRLSLDLMFGYPGNEERRLAATLEAALALEPEHLSAYCYIPESGTPLGDAVASGAVMLPEPDQQADLYQQVALRLEHAGMVCYETSNFCVPGAEARHNLVYWLRRPYLGLGPSAHGLLNGMRSGNHYALERWARALERGESAAAEVEPETRESVAREVMMLGLRLTDGLRALDYEPDVWRAVEERYATSFARAVANGRLEFHGPWLRIPRALHFVADEVIAWIDCDAERPRFDSATSGFLPSLPCPNLLSPAA